MIDLLNHKQDYDHFRASEKPNVVAMIDACPNSRLQNRTYG
jgi:hypothetical protein